MFRLISLSLLFVMACTPASRFPTISDAAAGKEAEKQRELVIEQTLKRQNRVLQVGQAILRAGAERCGDTVTQALGINATNAGLWPKDYKSAVKTVTGTGSRLKVGFIHREFPVHKSGLKIGDTITSINEQPVPDDQKGAEFLKNAIQSATGPLSMVIDRNGMKIPLIVKTDTICDYPIAIATDDAVNAFADGSSITITTGMLRFVETDDELALIIGHELAHNTESHTAMKAGNTFLGGLAGIGLTLLTGQNMMQAGMNLGAGIGSQDFESEADYVGVYFAARAGYDVKESAKLWRRMGAAHPQAIHLAGSTHPSSAKRFLAIEQTVEEIQTKKATGKPIEPDDREN